MLSAELVRLVKEAEDKLVGRAEIQKQVVAALGELSIQGIITSDNLLEALLWACQLNSKKPATIDCGTFEVRL